MLGVFKVAALILIAVPLGLSIDCYKCRRCSSAPSSWRKASNCGACLIETTYKKEQEAMIDRRCVKKCQPQETLVDGEGVKVECCYTDLCNAGDPSAAASLTLHTLVPTLAVLLSRLYL